MVTEDLDVSELIETIAATGREIEENSRVCTDRTRLQSGSIMSRPLLGHTHCPALSFPIGPLMINVFSF